MEHKLIHTENYLLVVDDSEIKNYYYDFFINKLKHSNGAEYGKSDIAKQIIAHLPLNNSTPLEGVDLLPPLEDDVEDLSEIIDMMSVNDKYKQAVYEGLMFGYNKAKETYNQLIEEQILNFQNDLKQSSGNLVKIYCDGALFVLEKLKQSLQQPKLPIAFECETYMKIGSDMNGRECWDGLERKTTTNSQGQTVWLGTYKF